MSEHGTQPDAITQPDGLAYDDAVAVDEPAVADQPATAEAHAHEPVLPDQPAAAETHAHEPAADDARSIDLGAVPFGAAAADESSPPPRSRTRLIVLGALLAIGLAGAIVLGTAGWRITSQNGATLTMPDQVAGLRVDTSDDAVTTTDYLQNALSAEVDLDEVVGGIYIDAASKDRSVLFFGGTALIWAPEKALATAFDLVKDDTGPVTGLHDVPSGQFGGTMRCGTTADAEGAIAVCGWSDHGSLALAMFPNRSAAEAAPLLLSIRDAVQKRD